MKNTIKIMLTVLSFNTSINAQNLVVTLINSSVESFPISEIQSIKFDPGTFISGTMILNKLDGTVITWSTGGIHNYSFNGVTSINETATVKTDELNVYPNPSADLVQINFSSNWSGEIRIDVYDMNGRLVEKLFHGNHQDETLLTWNSKQNSMVQSGKYLIKITTTNKVITKPIIIQ
jgi:hypothetical protein